MEIIKQKDAIEKIALLIKERNIIPVFGAGFSMDSEASKGKVPSGDKATELMKDILLKNCAGLTERELEDCDFNETAKLFYRLSDDIKHPFFEDYFTKVHLSSMHRSFLQFDWPYAYTLNVDDGIEQTGEFKEVLPYKHLNRPGTSRKLLYKLHGDAFTEITYTEEESIVFSSDQYLQSITDKRNRDFLTNLTNDFSFKNMIFIGCSLKYEPDLKYVYGKADHRTNTLKITLRSKEPTFRETGTLEEYGINTIILIEDYDRFFTDIIQKVHQLQAEEECVNYKFKNPSILEKFDKDYTYKFLSGENIFDLDSNSFYKGGMHIVRNCMKEIENYLEEEDCILLKGRRFSGKTYVMCSLVERQRKYTQFFFPSSTSVDEDILLKLLTKEKNSLFLFDSNALSPATYKLIANSANILKRNANKIVIAINSNDNYITESLKGIVIEIPNRFVGEEIKQNEECANKYGLIKRFYKSTNMDYLQKIEERQHIQIFNASKYYSVFSFNEQLIMLLLAVQDKVYMSNILDLDISFSEVTALLERLPLLIEEVDVDENEKTVHAATKLVHNSKVMLIHLLNRLSHDEIIKCIKYVVETFKDDYQRRRIAVDVILFDTLNQIFGGKSAGAGDLIFKVYEELQDILSDDLHYWLQRAKCIYHISQNDLEQLKEAYQYAKKVYFDSNYALQSKAALTAALISCLIYNIDEESEKNYYLGEAVYLGYEAVSSEYYRFNESYLNNELKSKKIRKSSYELLINACQIYMEIHVAGEYLERAENLQETLMFLKEHYNCR